MASPTYRFGHAFGAGACVVLLGIVAACSGAQEQDVLSKQVGSATTSSGSTGTSGDTSGATSSGTSGQTSSSGATSSGGTTSGGPGGGCIEEKEDSTEKTPITITSCVKGTFKVPFDEEDWLQFERPANAVFHAKWSGPLLVTFWDNRGNQYDLQHLPNRQGVYAIQLQYDYQHYPLSGEQLTKGVAVDWTFEISF